MKTVYLILYIWHASHITGYREPAGVGGPALAITAFQSVIACEVVGRAAKEMADNGRPSPVRAFYWTEGSPRSEETRGSYFASPPAAYRCVEVGP